MFGTGSLKESITELKNIIKNSPVYLDMLHKELSLCDREKSDIEHAIEATNFNASEGWKLSRDLQITLRRRREIKYEIDILKEIRDASKKNRSLEHQLNIVENLFLKHEDRINNATYTPRVRKDLKELYKIDKKGDV